MNRTLLTTLITMSFFGLFARAEPLAVGVEAPQVTAIDENGETVKFSDVYGKGATLVYFYPKADTPGCTAQACSLRDAFSNLKTGGVQVLGVSHDTPEAQKKFKEKYKLPFTLIADKDGKVGDAFHVPATLGFSNRQSFIIKGGKIAWVSLTAKTAEHAQEVQAALDEMK